MIAIDSPLNRAVTQLHNQFAVADESFRIERVEHGKNKGIHLESRSVNGRRWFYYDQQKIQEICPEHDKLIPLAKHLNGNFNQHQLLAYRPGRRMVLKRREQGQQIILKGYRSKKIDSAVERCKLAQILAQDSMLKVPELIEVNQQHGYTVSTFHAGRPLEVSRRYAYQFENIGTGIRQLQSMFISATLSLRQADAELALLNERSERCLEIAKIFPQGWQIAFKSLQRAESSLPPPSYVPTHRDLHDGQIVITENGIVVLDFDSLCIADEALDPANLAAHIKLRGLQESNLISEEDVLHCREALFATVQRSNASGFRERFNYYEAATLLRLSLLYFLRPSWSQLAEPLVQMAQKCLGQKHS